MRDGRRASREIRRARSAAVVAAGCAQLRRSAQRLFCPGCPCSSYGRCPLAWLALCLTSCHPKRSFWIKGDNDEIVL